MKHAPARNGPQRRRPVKRAQTTDIAQILTDTQVELLTEVVHEILGPAFVDAAKRLDVDTAQHLRFHAVAARCAAARERLGLDVKQVATRLGVPQYRVKAIERGCLSEIRADVLTSYTAFLSLDSWLRRWVDANPALAVDLGLVRSHSAPRASRAQSSRKGDTPSNHALEPAAPARSRAPRLSAKR